MPASAHALDGSPAPRRRGNLAPLIVFGLLLGTVLFLGRGAAPQPSTESVHRAMAARDLLEGRSRGRQALVGSLELAPLPTVITTLIALPDRDLADSAGVVIAAGAALLLCLYVNRMWANEGVSPALRYPALACLLFMPPVAVSMCSGQSTMLFVALVVSGWGFLTYWLRSGALRDLAYAALLLGLSVGVRHQAILLVGVALLLVAVASVLKRPAFSFLEATTLTFLAPTLYLLALWFGGNWLILGNPVFFLERTVESVRLGTADLADLLTGGCEWTVLATVGLLALAVPAAGSLSRRRRGGALRHVACFGSVLLTAWFSVSVQPAGEVRTLDMRVIEAVATLERRYPNASFIVTGYEGYEFQRAAGHDPKHAWIHLMRPEPGVLARTLADFEGREVYLLVNTERPRTRWDRVELEWRRPGTRVPEGFIYAETVGPWKVFECIRATEPLRAAP